ncbi:Alpha/Beta hydrolase protein [Podospora appendiculata]|uniref:Alpha/Beta hydrolase protein n=1 Tax=Podospora appendiculata TaxID=314037 RepID=A0AAE0X4D5_9PEZI|nr:Alpha/Beta hydrolase protein [Podospora appendiculata]
MKTTLFYSLPVLAATTLASPVLMGRDATVTAAQLNNFQLFAQYSAASYCNNQNVPGQPIACTNDVCLAVQANQATTSSSFTGNITDVRGVIAVDDTAGLIVVSFRGSVSVRNWITDAVFTQIACDLVPGCLVHAGFFAAWSEVKPAVVAGLKSAVAANPSYKIVTTGHSLGAGLATIATAYLRKSGYAIDIYTYGSPRIGNRQFADFVTAQPGLENRVTHFDDPFARLPPILFNYRHTSPEYWFKNNATVNDVVQVCTGNANISCNAGTTGLDFDAHSSYFVKINGCSPPGGTPWRRDLTDAQLEDKLNSWAALDVALAENLAAANS